MTTPNEETIKDKNKLRRFFEQELKQGASEEDFEKFLEMNARNNPASNPNNPWIIAEKKKERDI